MPELPEVEIFKRFVDSKALRKKIVRAEISCPDLVKEGRPKALIKNLVNQSFVSTERRGKYLFAKLSNDSGALILHFGMSGSITYYSPRQAVPQYGCLTVSFSKGDTITYVNPRRIGLFGYTSSIDSFIKKKRLGPDILSISKEEFLNRVRKNGRVVKAVLMDQSLFAGIGNIYSDEILFQAKINPKTKATALTEESWIRLFGLIRRVLNQAINSDAEPERMPHNFLITNRRKNGSCPVCKSKLVKTSVMQRPTYFCPRCQTT